MGWLTKILKGSSHKISEGQYLGKYDDERIWEGPSTIVVIIQHAENVIRYALSLYKFFCLC